MQCRDYLKSIIMKVINLNGTSRFNVPSGYSSWIEYWEAVTGLKASICSAAGCFNKSDLVGAHVQKVNSSDKKMYIVPLCRGCNQRTDEFDVYMPLAPVPSNL